MSYELRQSIHDDGSLGLVLDGREIATFWEPDDLKNATRILQEIEIGKSSVILLAQGQHDEISRVIEATPKVRESIAEWVELRRAWVSAVANARSQVREEFSSKQEMPKFPDTNAGCDRRHKWLQESLERMNAKIVDLLVEAGTIPPVSLEIYLGRSTPMVDVDWEELSGDGYMYDEYRPAVDKRFKEKTK